MNRNVLHTFATASALALVTVAAQAATVGPTFYGRINASYDHFDTEGAGDRIARRSLSNVDRWELNSNFSRIGVRGNFDLDHPGLQAVYQAEYEINVDDGNRGDDAFSQRNTFGGLQHERYGRLIYGKIDTPLKAAEGKIDQFNDLYGDLDSLIGGQNRVSDSVQYSTPTLLNGAVTINAAFQPGEDRDVDADGKPDDGAADSWSASVVYDKDGYYAALGYDSNQAARRTLDGVVRADAIRAVGGIKQGAFEAGVLLQRTSDVAPGSSREDNSWLVSGAYTIDRVKLKAQYGSSKADVGDEKGKLASLGLDYSLAKQSVVYGYWTQLELDDLDAKDNVFGVGVAHSF